MAAVATGQGAIPSSLLAIMLDSPAASTPDGVAPEFTNPPNLHIYLYITLVLGLVLATVTLALRMFTKAFIIRSVSWDDYTILLSWIFVCVPLVGIHMWSETIGELITALYSVNNAEIIYVPSILFCKISILLQYLRIFAPTRNSNPVMWWVFHTAIWVNVVFYVIELFFDIFTCEPRDLVWNPLLNGWCWDIHRQLLSIAYFNMVSDVIILLLPQYSIWRLHMSRKRKIGISAIFGLGLVACVFTAVRVQSSVLLVETNDVSWYLAQLGMWAIAEIAIAIICSSLPTMPKLYQAVCRKITERSSSSIFRTPKSISKGSSSMASEKPSKTDHHPWLNTTTTTTAISGVDDLERNTPEEHEFHVAGDPRSLPVS